MRIQLSDHFTFNKLLRFTIPSIIMMICTSVYSIIDGLFVSNYVGKEPFAALNLMMPFLMALGTVGFMIGTGGSAIVAITLGEGKTKKANKYFSMFIYVAIILGIVLGLLGIIFMRPIAIALGATEELLGHSIIYGRIIAAAIPAFMLQYIFQSFFVTAEKPGLSLKVSIAAGLTNVVFDFLFIVVFKWEIAGAALATAMGQIVGGVVPIVYFARENSSILRLGKTKFYGKILLKACVNGCSELMTNISMSVVNILYNLQLMKLAGEDGVAAYGVIMYANFVFAAVYIGYSIGTAPIVGYHYGAENTLELKSLFKKSLTLIGIAGICMTILGEVLSYPLTKMFVGYDEGLFQLTCHGFRLYAISFLICGFNIWGSGFFTALGDGITSAVISFLRTLVFQVAVVLILPMYLKIDGIWLAIVVAEVLALLVTGIFLVQKRKKYQY